MIVCIKNLAHTFSLFLTTICNKSATLNSSDPYFSQPISIYLLHLYKSPDAPSPKFIEKLTRTTGSDSSTREKENRKAWQFLKMGGLEKNSTKQIVGVPENVNNNNSVFQIFLMSSKHRQPKLEKFSSNNTTTTTTTTMNT
jgi:hypothetical protein